MSETKENKVISIKPVEANKLSAAIIKQQAERIVEQGFFDPLKPKPPEIPASLIPMTLPYTVKAIIQGCRVKFDAVIQIVISANSEEGMMINLNYSFPDEYSEASEQWMGDCKEEFERKLSKAFNRDMEGTIPDVHIEIGESL